MAPYHQTYFYILINYISLNYKEQNSTEIQQELVQQQRTFDNQYYNFIKIRKMADQAKPSIINSVMKSQSQSCDSTTGLSTPTIFVQADLKRNAKKLTDQSNKRALVTLEDCFPLIGMIRVNWFNKKGTLICINYGTAFAISSRLILTCAHNIYSQKKDLYCSQIFFYPGICDQQLTKQTKRYKSAKNVFLKNTKPQRSMVISPLKQELAMIVLEEQLQNEFYFKVATIQNLSTKSDLAIIGYPSQAYCKSVNLNDIHVQRQVVQGKLHKIRDHVIHHTMTTTKVGHSGSPILIKNQQDQYQVIGIHTHKGIKSYYNSGLFFNQQILGLIKGYREYLEKQHNIQPGLKTDTVDDENGKGIKKMDDIVLDYNPQDEDYQNTSTIDQYDYLYNQDFQEQLPLAQQSKEPNITKRDSLKDIVYEHQTTKSQLGKVTVGLKSIHQISGEYYLE